VSRFISASNQLGAEREDASNFVTEVAVLGGCLILVSVCLYFGNRPAAVALGMVLREKLMVVQLVRAHSILYGT
jgi:hypothetical protein